MWRVKSNDQIRQIVERRPIQCGLINEIGMFKLKKPLEKMNEGRIFGEKVSRSA